MNTDNATVYNIVRRSIGAQIREHCATHGLNVEITHDDRVGIRYVINGETLTPGEAANRYLPGGFAGSFGEDIR